MSKIDSGIFQPPDTERDLVVVRVEPQDVPRVARGVLDVMNTAYARQFEAAEGALPAKNQVPAGSALRHFGASGRTIRQREQTERMQRYMAEEGSAYWVAYGTRYYEPGEGIIGIAKTSPSRATWWQKLGKVIGPIDNPNCYVNDVAVTEPRRGIGSALLYVALHDYSEDRTVVADLPKGAEGFFEANGFVSGDAIEPFVMAGAKIPQVRAEVPSVEQLQGSLVSHKAWLTEGALY